MTQERVLYKFFNTKIQVFNERLFYKDSVLWKKKTDFKKTSNIRDDLL